MPKERKEQRIHDRSSRTRRCFRDCLSFYNPSSNKKPIYQPNQFIDIRNISNICKDMDSRRIGDLRYWVSNITNPMSGAHFPTRAELFHQDRPEDMKYILVACIYEYINDISRRDKLRNLIKYIINVAISNYHLSSIHARIAVDIVCDTMSGHKYEVLCPIIANNRFSYIIEKMRYWDFEKVDTREYLRFCMIIDDLSKVRHITNTYYIPLLTKLFDADYTPRIRRFIDDIMDKSSRYNRRAYSPEDDDESIPDTPEVDDSAISVFLRDIRKRVNDEEKP